MTESAFPLKELKELKKPTHPGSLVASTYTNGFLTGVTGYASSISYHPNGQVNQIVRANGTTDTYTKDPQNQLRPNKIDTKVTSTGAIVWSSGVYSYDGAGNVVKMGSSYFLHDAVSRIDSGTLYTGYGGGATGPEPFDHAYDGFGNLQSMTSNGVLRNTPTSSGSNRLTGSVGYDAAGALTAWNGASYSYDEAGMMWRMVSGTEDWIYVYTADDERIWSYKPAANLSRWTLRGLDQKVLREYQNLGGTWSVQKDYVYRGSDVLAAETPTGVNHLHPDHLGTVRAVTNSTGTRIAYHAYFPFGEEATSPTQDTERMKFTGHERDLANPASPADDLDYMHARFYNPLTGRFLSVDPARSEKTYSPQTWNRYTYGLSNPLKYIDPDGRESLAVLAFEQDARALIRNEISREEFHARNAARAQGGLTGLSLWGNVLLAKSAVTGIVGVVRGLQLARGAAFASRDLLIRHFEKHGAEFGAKTAREYLRKAQHFVRQEGTETVTRKNGDKLFYDAAKNEFAVVTKNGTIRTYFKPEKGAEYWKDQVARAAKEAI